MEDCLGLTLAAEEGKRKQAACLVDILLAFGFFR
jgi:hypothetical protein